MRLVILTFFSFFIYSSFYALEQKSNYLNDNVIVFICSENQVNKVFHTTSSCDLLRGCGGGVYSTSKTQAKIFGFMSCKVCAY